jgi:hypothetical protein
LLPVLVVAGCLGVIKRPEEDLFARSMALQTEEAEKQISAAFANKDYGRARDALAQYRRGVEPPYQDQTRIELWESRIAVLAAERRMQLAKEIDAVLAQRQGRVALAFIAMYGRLPDAEDERMAEWRRQARPFVAREQAVSQVAQARLAAQLKAIRELALKKAISALRKKYPGWVLPGKKARTQEAVRLTLLTYTTVLGAPFFSDVEIDIDEHLLSLWLADPNSVGTVQNMQTFAMLADQFVAWCGCNGVTKVGVDMTWMNGGKRRMLTYRLNHQTGRSGLSR